MVYSSESEPHTAFRIVAPMACIFSQSSDWGEPERAPHKREVRAVCLSVCRSVRIFMT